MRRARTIAAAFSAVLACAAATPPAWAGYGALARDQATGKFGLSWDRPTPQQAEQAAMKDCAESSCKTVFRTKSHQCEAIATATKEQSTAWGASVKATRAAAELSAMSDCQKRTSGQCKVQASGCNR
jgi:Domain of unknown function (DUF4189)